MQVVDRERTHSVYDSSSDQRNDRTKSRKKCCESDSALMLVFDNTTFNPQLKHRISALWEALGDTAAVCEKEPRVENYFLVGKPIKEEAPKSVQEPAADEKGGVRLLFDKMLALRMDQHALAIADGYRTRPQVCVCDDACCKCFDYSNFLHNLKLHDRKEALSSVYAKMGKDDEKPKWKSGGAESEPTGDGEKVSTPSRGEKFDEFTIKSEEDYAGDDPNEVDLDLTVIERVKKLICSEKTTCPEKTVSTPERKVKRGAPVRVIKIDEPPYETKLNTVHRRVTEFDPNLYKNLVREEIKNFNQMSAAERRSRAADRVKNLSQRPPWKI